MANKVLIVLVATVLLVAGAAGGGGSVAEFVRPGPGETDPEHCLRLMRGFIEESRQEDASRPRRTLDTAWTDTGRAIVKLNRIESVLRRNGCPYLMDEKTGKGAPFRIGLPGEKPGPGVFVVPPRP